jgi:hypothetical protein
LFVSNIRKKGEIKNNNVQYVAREFICSNQTRHTSQKHEFAFGSVSPIAMKI